MSNYNDQIDNFSKSRLKSSYTSVVVSLSLLLFMLGIFGFSIIKGKSFLDYVKESFLFSIVLKEDAKDLDIMLLEKELKLMKEIKDVKYIKKEDALEKLKEELGIDFMQYLSTNPLFNSYDVTLKSEYINESYIKEIKEILEKKEIIDEVLYDNIFLINIDQNIKKIQFWVLIISSIFFIICIILIYNAIKLSLYSKRFTIKTMQLVGASQYFISKPFILKNIFFAILSFIFTLTGLLSISIFLSKTFPLLFSNRDNDFFYSVALYVVLLLFSISFTTLTTYISIRKFLRKRVEELYS